MIRSSYNLHYLQQNFFAYTYESENISEHITALQDLASKLSERGQKVEESALMIKILMTRPEDFRHFRSAWEEVVEESKQNINDLTARFLMEEKRLKEEQANNNSTALAQGQGP